MRLVISLLLAAQVACQPIFYTNFEEYPNMACQMYNAWEDDPSTPGFSGFDVMDYATGLIATRDIATAPLRRDASLRAALNAAFRRSETCGESYCRRLITYGEIIGGGGLTKEQHVNDHQYPAPSIPRPPGMAFLGGFGRGWDYSTEVFGVDPRNVLQCDEYPYASTYEGGGGHFHIPRVNCIFRSENGGHGSKLGNFYAANNLPDGAPFFVEVLDFPTTFLTSINPLTIRCPNFCWRQQQGMPYPAGIPTHHILQATPNIACIVD